MSLINVFVSRPTWVDKKFEDGLTVFINRIEDLGLKARTIGITDQPTKAPLDEVLDLLNECRGAVILGYPQIEFSSGKIKGNDVKNISLATEWNHIEAGLAYAKNLPLLVIHHQNVIRGIFDRGALNSFIYEFDLEDKTWSQSSAVTKILRKWRDQCLIRDNEEKQKVDELEQTQRNIHGARISVKLIKQPRFNKSGYTYRVRINNDGPEDAENVNLNFPDGNDPVIESEYKTKLPIELLPVNSDYDLIAGVDYDTSPPFKAEINWKDSKGEHSKIYPLT